MKLDELNVKKMKRNFGEMNDWRREKDGEKKTCKDSRRCKKSQDI